MFIHFCLGPELGMTDVGEEDYQNDATSHSLTKECFSVNKQLSIIESKGFAEKQLSLALFSIGSVVSVLRDIERVLRKPKVRSHRLT
jgi:hypothetical protein